MLVFLIKKLTNRFPEVLYHFTFPPATEKDFLIFLTFRFVFYLVYSGIQISVIKTILISEYNLLNSVSVVPAGASPGRGPGTRELTPGLSLQR